MAESTQWSCDIHTTLPLRIGKKGYAAAPPITVGELFRKTRDAFPDNVALSWKDGDEWKRMTYVEYYNECVRAAKSFLKVSDVCLSVCLICIVCLYVCMLIASHCSTCISVLNYTAWPGKHARCHFNWLQLTRMGDSWAGGDFCWVRKSFFSITILHKQGNHNSNNA